MIIILKNQFLLWALLKAEFVINKVDYNEVILYCFAFFFLNNIWIWRCSFHQFFFTELQHFLLFLGKDPSKWGTIAERLIAITQCHADRSCLKFRQNAVLVIWAGMSKAAENNADHFTPMCVVGYRSWYTFTMLALWTTRLGWTFDLCLLVKQHGKLLQS